MWRSERRSVRAAIAIAGLLLVATTIWGCSAAADPSAGAGETAAPTQRVKEPLDPSAVPTRDAPSAVPTREAPSAVPTREASPGSSSTDTPKSGTSAPAEGAKEPLDPRDVPAPETAPPVSPTNAPGRQDSVLAALPGDSSPGCVAVEDERDVRSGSMAAGNFVDARNQFAESPDSAIPLYFIPEATEGDLELVVELEEVKGSASDVLRSSALQTANQWRYFSVAAKIPKPGVWRITASAGKANAGCWEVRFKN